jgi:YggT family protein
VSPIVPAGLTGLTGLTGLGSSVATGAAGLVSGTARTQSADYLSTLIYVYTIIIILHIVVQLLLSSGVRPPYSRTTDAILGFLRDICEPFLRIFRRVLPSFGGLDFSPIVAIIALQLFNSIVIQGIVHG